MADYIHDIKTLLPQGPPFILVDRLLFTDGIATRTNFQVPASSPLVEGGRLTVAGLVENMAQTVAAGAGYTARETGEQARAGFIVSVRNLEIKDLPGIGDELLTEITVTTRVADIIVISGRITCQQRIIATGELQILTGV